MKLIVAVVRPEMRQPVKDAVKEAGINGMTIMPVFGRGSQAGIKFTNRTGEFIADELEKVMIMVVVEDEALVNKVVDAIHGAACTGKPGDGRIMIAPIESFLKIRSI